MNSLTSTVGENSYVVHHNGRCSIDKTNSSLSQFNISSIILTGPDLFEIFLIVFNRVSHRVHEGSEIYFCARRETPDKLVESSMAVVCTRYHHKDSAVVRQSTHF